MARTPAGSSCCARYPLPMIGWVVVAGLGALALLVLRRVFAGHPRPEVPPQVLRAREMAFLAAAADATYPAGGAIPTSGSQARVAERTDAWMAQVDPGMRLLMRLLFFLVEHATVLFPAPGRGGFRRFSSLAPHQREAALRGWATSALPPRRLVFQSLRAVVTMAYLSDAAVLREVGLAPRDVEVAPGPADLLFPPIGHGPESIRFGPEDLRDVAGPATLACDAPLDPRYAGGAS